MSKVLIHEIHSAANNVSDISICEVISVCGNFHQGDNVFPSNSRGYQCTCNALVALCWLAQCTDTVSPSDLDDILQCGDQVYQTILTHQGAGYLQFCSLPSSLTYKNVSFEVQQLDRFYPGKTAIGYASLVGSERL